MNMIDAKVTKIKSEPVHKYNHWFVECEIEAYGSTSETEAMFDTREQAVKFSVGDVIQV